MLPLGYFFLAISLITTACFLLRIVKTRLTEIIILACFGLIFVILFTPLSSLHQALTTTSSSTFQNTFGVKPSHAIKNLKGENISGFDFVYNYLVFDNSDAAWSEILGFGVFTPIPETSAVLYNSDGDVPEWWHVSECTNATKLELSVIFGQSKLSKQWDDLVIVRCNSDSKIYVMSNQM